MSRHLKNKHPSMINEAPKYSTAPSNTTQESSSFSDELQGRGNSYANQRNIQSPASDIGESNCVDGLVSENVNASEPTLHDLDTVLRKLLDNLTTNRGNAITNIGPTQSEGGVDASEDQDLEENEECSEEEDEEEEEEEEEEEDKCTILHNNRLLWFL